MKIVTLILGASALITTFDVRAHAAGTSDKVPKVIDALRAHVATHVDALEAKGSGLVWRYEHNRAKQNARNFVDPQIMWWGKPHEAQWTARSRTTKEGLKVTRYTDRGRTLSLAETADGGLAVRAHERKDGSHYVLSTAVSANGDRAHSFEKEHTGPQSAAASVFRQHGETSVRTETEQRTPSGLRVGYKVEETRSARDLDRHAEHFTALPGQQPHYALTKP